MSYRKTQPLVLVVSLQSCAPITTIAFQDIFVTPKKPMSLSVPSCVLLLPALSIYWSTLALWIGLFWTFPIESQYVAFCICLLSLSILLSGLVCVVGCISSSFLFMNNIPYMTIAYIFIHCAVDSIQQMMVVISRVVSAFCLF